MIADEEDVHAIILHDNKGKPLQRTSWLLYNDETASIPSVKTFIEFIKKYPFFEVKGQDK